MMMRNNRVFRSLGVTQFASILSSNSNAKSKGVAREELDPFYGPTGDEEDNEHGVVNKDSETRSVVRPIGGTRGSKRVLAGPTQQDSIARVISKRAQDQSSSNEGMTGTSMNGDDDAVLAAPVAPAQVDEEKEMDNEAELFTEYERERAQTIMRNNQIFRSLGIIPMSSILNSSTNAKSKGATREDSDPLYEPAGEEDIEYGVVDKVSHTRSVGKSHGGTRGSQRVSAGPTQRALGEGAMTRKRARGQTIEGGTSTNEEVDELVAAPAQVDEHEGEPNAMINQRSRGRSMGKGLERMSRGLNSKVPVVIVEGMRRPEAPMQAAKLASEGGIVLRQHMPIHPH
ncbi:unnamed protein product [Urochloa humidicola]